MLLQSERALFISVYLLVTKVKWNVQNTLFEGPLDLGLNIVIIFSDHTRKGFFFL